MLITPVYAAVSGLFFIVLSVRTVRLRRRLRVAIGDGENPSLARAARVHSNFAEYVPLALILLFFLETQTNASGWIHILAIGLFLGRLSHAFGVSRVNENPTYRVTGMVLTFGVIISASISLLTSSIRSFSA